MIGTTVAGCTVERWVAASDHATVFFARRNGAPVALKLASRDASDPRASARLAREAIALARIEHPCVLPLLDAGLWSDGTPYVVTPWVAGDLLEDRLRGGRMSWPAIADALAAIARGLRALHATGVVHRDLKPSNVILPAGGDPVAIILDLGHAHVFGDLRITQSGAAVGSLPYMAPEQLEGHALDHRADLYALGVILYRALTGELPFEPIQLLRGARDLVPPRKRAPSAGITPSAEDLCMWLLAVNPGDRLPSAAVLAVTLGAITH